MLLYPNAFWDVSPVTILSHRYKTFIFYDGRPNPKHLFPKTWSGKFNTAKKLLEGVIIQLKLSGSYDSHEKLNDDCYKLNTKGGQIIYYFFNTENDQIQDKPILKDLLPQVEGIYLRGGGFESFHMPVPNAVKEIYGAYYGFKAVDVESWGRNKRIIKVPDGDHLPLWTYYGSTPAERITLFNVLKPHPNDTTYTPEFPDIYKDEHFCKNLLNRF